MMDTHSNKGTVLLLGARSFIGGQVCRALVRHGYRVLIHSTTTLAFTNLEDFLPHPMVTAVQCGYQQTEKLRSYMQQCDYMIISAVAPGKQTLGKGWARAIEFRDFQKMMETLKSADHIKKSVFLSTCSTIGRVEGIADESCIAAKPHGWAGLKMKFRIEKLVMDYVRAGLPVTIVNPTMYIGEYDSRPSSGEFFKFIRSVPVMVLKGLRINIVDVEAAANGIVLALEKGRVGERYLLSGENILFDDFYKRVKELTGKPLPKVTVSYGFTVFMAVLTELLNLILRQQKPLIPLVGIELKKFGNQHFSCEKAKRELGYDPGNAWTAFDKAFQWYKKKGIL